MSIQSKQSLARHTLFLLLVCLLCLAVGTVIQYWLLPTDVNTSMETGEIGVSGIGTFHYLVKQDRLVEGKPGVVTVTFREKDILFRPSAYPSDTNGGPLWLSGAAVFQFPIIPVAPGKSLLTVGGDLSVAGSKVAAPITIEVPIHVSPSLSHRIWFSVLISIPVFMIGLGLYFWILSSQRKSEALEAKIANAESKAEREPEKARPAWILAQTKLEAYFDRNLQQVNQVFVVAIGVMCVGFLFVLIGVVMSFHESKITPVEIVASGAGIITEFIGATFMVIYRSTMAQANEFMSVLERINTVGMTVQVLDSIPDADPKLKNETRAHIVDLLLSANIRSKSTKEEK